MRKKIFLGIGIVLLIIIGYVGYILATTKSHSPFERVTFSQGALEINVEYCKPYKKERLIFGAESDGALVPYGKYWRIGANEATTIEVNRSVKIGEAYLNAGKYKMYAYPEKDSWLIVFNTDWDTWGVPEPNKKNVVAETSVPVHHIGSFQEQLTISFSPIEEGQNLIIHWDDVAVMLPFAEN